MKFSEYLLQPVYSEFLDESDRYNEGQSDGDIMFEMSTLTPRETGLPNGIEIWTRSDPINHGHNRYRVKVLKNRAWAAIFSVGSSPILLKNINQSLTDGEQTIISSWIAANSSTLINLIDCKISTTDCVVAIQKTRGGI